jgi:hypothetical protein
LNGSSCGSGDFEGRIASLRAVVITSLKSLGLVSNGLHSWIFFGTSNLELSCSLITDFGSSFITGLSSSFIIGLSSSFITALGSSLVSL